MAKEAKNTQEMVHEQKGAQTAEVKSLYVKGVNDKDFRTSDGFFKDPFTGKEFTGNEERVDSGTKTPRIKDSQGNTIPIAYKFWTKEEREAFKSGSSSGSKSTGSHSSSGNKKSEELRKGLLSLKDYLTKNKKMDDEIEKLINAMLPPDPEQEKLAKKVAGMTEEQKAALRALLNA